MLWAHSAHHSPLRVVQVEPVACKVEGTLPTWLKGYAVGNGSGDYEAAKHLFGGWGLVRKLRFDGKGAYYQQR